MGRKKKEIKLKEPVRIREKRLSDGNISLYLDMYHKGARKKEGLKLYLVPETTSAARMQNANTRKLAEQIKAQRILDIQQHGLVDWEGIKRSHITLSEWVDKYTAEECGLSKESMRSKRNAQARVEQYLIYIGRHDIALRDVDKDFCKGYIAFLKTCTFNNGKKTLSNTTCRIFVNRLTAALTKAVSEGLIDRNPFKLLDAKEKPQKNSSIREFLTIEEVKQLMATPCRYEIVKRAFLFSCFTGLRYSDIKTLLWSEIRKAADGRTLFLEHPQVKTRKIVTVPLSEEALKWMPRQQKDKEHVFHQLQITSTTVEVILGEWMKEAGIEKHITYHCSRHTAATMLLTLGADLYTVSKILGHSSIKMTEVYAKIVDKKKLETVNLVNNMFN
ncbi:MAG: site-specific integrase [Prevotella sp.]|mgnify:FL=1|jgi:integrase/recombinase XerD|nr:site-specific integrase [bacterium]MCI7016433.1 site-specific integrase [Prevotella sp.]MDY5023522.1 site-specific integrase [Candidatus Egerieousia sp.]MDD7046020.1 site-specific integrase [Prevotella sp.]MDD7173307.1 site-specific integrase [Prevotella sp.]